MTCSPGGTVSVKGHRRSPWPEVWGAEFRTPGQWEGQSGAAGAMGPRPALVRRAVKCPDIPALRGPDYWLQLDSESELLPARAVTGHGPQRLGLCASVSGGRHSGHPAGPELRPDTGSSAREEARLQVGG